MSCRMSHYGIGTPEEIRQRLQPILDVKGGPIKQQHLENLVERLAHALPARCSTLDVVRIVCFVILGWREELVGHIPPPPTTHWSRTRDIVALVLSHTDEERRIEAHQWVCVLAGKMLPPYNHT